MKFIPTESERRMATMWPFVFFINIWKHFFCTPFLIPLMVNIIVIPIVGFVFLQEASWLPDNPEGFAWEFLAPFLPSESVSLRNAEFFSIAAWFVLIVGIVGSIIEFLLGKHKKPFLMSLNLYAHIFILIIYVLIGILYELYAKEVGFATVMTFVFGMQALSFFATFLYVKFYRLATSIQRFMSGTHTKYDLNNMN